MESVGEARSAPGSPFSGASPPPVPPPEAVEKSDGSFVQELPDGSTLRWTKRPDGTWRRPEHQKCGWNVGPAAAATAMADTTHSRTGSDEGLNGTNGSYGGAAASSSMAKAVEGGEELAVVNGGGLNGPAVGSNGGEAAPEDVKEHALHCHWFLWVLRRSAEATGEDVETKRERLYEIATAEDFWRLVKHAYAPTTLVDSYYCLFRKDVSPNWEDPALIGGGRWVVRLGKLEPEMMDSLWQSVQMALIGEAFVEYEGGENIVLGASFQVRRRVSKLSLWLAQAANEKQVMALGHVYHEILASAAASQGVVFRHFSFEDFSRQQVTLWLPRAGEQDGSTAGIFQ
eukprot:TRINITY_DN80160_c0_g1_i1.p1 TRINITY_DN80160_c0_g1~~TRINITY_DN80160_c0_g1_i1.p1  ORF type:complete len:343 (-),score=94.02 TRINITY_DN80160_c0_g1_i1:111-1139(-)